MEMGMAAKALAGIGLLGGGGAGAYYGYRYLAKDEEISKAKFDEALINFLDASKNQDIIFEVKKGANFTEDLANTEPSSLANPVKVRVQVKVTDSMKPNEANDSFKFTAAANEESGPLKDVLALNKGKPWTWSCDIEFKKVTGAINSDLYDETKKQIVDNGNKGLFGILTKNVNEYTNTDAGNNNFTKADLTKAKKDFISSCSSKRASGDTIKVGEDWSNNQLNITVPAFEFKNGTGNGKAGKLIPNDDTEFTNWFKTDYRTKNYKSAS